MPFQSKNSIHVLKTEKESRIHFTPIFQLIHFVTLTDAFVSPSVVRFGFFPRRTSNRRKTSTLQECTLSDMNTVFERVYFFKIRTPFIQQPFHFGLCIPSLLLLFLLLLGLETSKPFFLSTSVCVAFPFLWLWHFFLFDFFFLVHRTSERTSERASTLLFLLPFIPFNFSL